MTYADIIGGLRSSLAPLLQAREIPQLRRTQRAAVQTYRDGVARFVRQFAIQAVPHLDAPETAIEWAAQEGNCTTTLLDGLRELRLRRVRVPALSYRTTNQTALAWQQMARTALAGLEQELPALDMRTWTISQRAAALNDAADLTRALVVLDDRYGTQHGWRPLTTDPAGLRTAAREVSDWAATGTLDYAIDDHGYQRPSAHATPAGIQRAINELHSTTTHFGEVMLHDQALNHVLRVQTAIALRGAEMANAMSNPDLAESFVRRHHAINALRRQGSTVTRDVGGTGSFALAHTSNAYLAATLSGSITARDVERLDRAQSRSVRAMLDMLDTGLRNGGYVVASHFRWERSRDLIHRPRDQFRTVADAVTRPRSKAAVNAADLSDAIQTVRDTLTTEPLGADRDREWFAWLADRPRQPQQARPPPLTHLDDPAVAAVVLRLARAAATDPEFVGLPNPERLAERFGTSRVTVRNAIERLVAEGIVNVEGGVARIADRHAAGRVAVATTITNLHHLASQGATEPPKPLEALTLVRAADVGGPNTLRNLIVANVLQPIRDGYATLVAAKVTPELRAASLADEIPERGVAVGATAAWVHAGRQPPTKADYVTRSAFTLIGSHSRDIGGVRVATAERTMVDLASRWPMERAVPVALDLVRAGASLEDANWLLEMRVRSVNRPGARDVLKEVRAVVAEEAMAPTPPVELEPRQPSATPDALVDGALREYSFSGPATSDVAFEPPDQRRQHAEVLASSLAARIAHGDLNETLPGNAQLVRDYRVPPATMSDARKILSDLGVIDHTRGGPATILDATAAGALTPAEISKVGHPPIDPDPRRPHRDRAGQVLEEIRELVADGHQIPANSLSDRFDVSRTTAASVLESIDDLDELIIHNGSLVSALAASGGTSDSDVDYLDTSLESIEDTRREPVGIS